MIKFLFKKSLSKELCEVAKPIIPVPVLGPRRSVFNRESE